MEAPGARTKVDIAQLGMTLARLCAIPKTSTTVDAFFSVKFRNSAALSLRDRLRGTDLDTEFVSSFLTGFRSYKRHMISVTGRGLDFSAPEKRILMRDQEFAVQRDLRPADAVHEKIVNG